MTKLNRGVGAAAAAAALAAGGVAWAASTGTADPVPVPSAAEVAGKSELVKNANDQPGLGLDASKAQRLDLSKAPSGLQRAEFLLIPSKSGPCLLRNDRGQGATGTDEASMALVALGSLSCGIGDSPTVAITPDGTIGAVAAGDTVDVVLANGDTIAAAIDADGVWFAAPGATKAQITSGGSTTTVDLLPSR